MMEWAASYGGSHLLRGLHDAKLDQASVLAVTGIQFHDLVETFTQQVVNLERAFEDVARFNAQVTGPEHMENLSGSPFHFWVFDFANQIGRFYPTFPTAKKVGHFCSVKVPNSVQRIVRVPSCNPDQDRRIARLRRR